MIIEELTVTAFDQHTRIVGCEKTRRAICIVRAIDDHRLELQGIACTHAHLDHIGGVASLKRRKPEAKILIHKADEWIYTGLPEQPAWIGIPRTQWKAFGFDFETPPPV